MTARRMNPPPECPLDASDEGPLLAELCLPATPSVQTPLQNGVGLLALRNALQLPRIR